MSIRSRSRGEVVVMVEIVRWSSLDAFPLVREKKRCKLHQSVEGDGVMGKRKELVL